VCPATAKRSAPSAWNALIPVSSRPRRARERVRPDPAQTVEDYLVPVQVLSQHRRKRLLALAERELVDFERPADHVAVEELQTPSALPDTVARNRLSSLIASASVGYGGQ